MMNTIDERLRAVGITDLSLESLCHDKNNKHVRVDDSVVYLDSSKRYLSSITKSPKALRAFLSDWFGSPVKRYDMRMFMIPIDAFESEPEPPQREQKVQLTIRVSPLTAGLLEHISDTQGISKSIYIDNLIQEQLGGQKL